MNNIMFKCDACVFGAHYDCEGIDCDCGDTGHYGSDEAID